MTDRLLILDTRTGESRVLLNVAPSRLEMAAGGGFSVAAATGYIYFSAVARDANIWLATPAGTQGADPIPAGGNPIPGGGV